ncbi:MAG: GNAT family N-acetyltransferase [Nitrospinota bacterium]|nr:GNAT family N-acetyltransferase [Nitrospinota bacterium]
MHGNEITVYHSEEWKEILAKTYGYHDMSYGYGSDLGILAPGMIVNNRILRKRFLLSLPFSDEAGPVSSTCNIKQIENFFLFVDETLMNEKLDYVELKGVSKHVAEEAKKFNYDTIYRNYTFRIDLSQSLESLQGNLHHNIKRILKKNRPIRIDSGPGKMINEYYAMHRHTMKNLGTPPHSRAFFENISKLLGENAEFHHALLDGKLVASILVLTDQTNYCARYFAGASYENLKNLNATTYLFMNAIKSAKNKGVRYFDFGVSREGTGVWNYKQKWTKYEPIEVHYIIKGKTKDYIDPRNRKIELFSHIWRNYLPEGIANLIGPFIRGELGK